MRVITTSLVSSLFVSLALATLAVADDGERTGARQVRESVEVSNHLVFDTDTVAHGATILVRDLRNQEVNATVTTRALEPDTAYSIWWAVFNFPQFCIEPGACSLADLGEDADPRVKPSVFWAGGFVSDIYGVANTSIRLVPGSTDRELFANTQNYGLQNLRGAEIHVVLRTHGIAGVAGTIAAQIGTASQACPAEGCANVFASIHRAGQTNPVE